MTQASPEQIAGLAIAAGMKNVPVMVAIALAESSGNTDAIGDVGLETAEWGPSVGLWQIRSMNNQKGTGGQRDEVANHNPAINAKHAAEISSGGTGFTAWSTYNNGAYFAFMGKANSAAKNPDNTMGGSAAASTSGSSGGSAIPGFDFIVKFFKTLANPYTWLRLFELGIGATCIFIGIIMVAKGTSAGKAAANVGKEAAKIALVAAK